MVEIMTPEDRVERAWSKLTLGPGWEDRLSALMAEEIRDAIAQAAATQGSEKPLPFMDAGRHPDDPEFDAVCDTLWDKYK